MPQRAPALAAAGAFAAGILLAWNCWRPPAWWAVAACVFVAAAAWWAGRRPRFGVAAAMLAIATLGALSYAARSAEFSGESASAIGRFADGRPYVISAHVVRDGMARAGRGQQRQTVDLETEEIAPADGGEAQRVVAGVRLGLYTHEESEEEEMEGGAGARVYRYGQRLRFVGKLREPRNFGNPGQWDYRGYLADRGITALGTARADRVEAPAGFAGSRFGLWRSRARRSVIEKVHALWPKQQAALMDAMLIGDTTMIDRETRIAFQRTGAYHILVVSGMNVGILAFVVFWLLRRLRVGEMACSAITLVLSGAYAYLCEGGAPIVRATVMLAIYLGTRLVYRERALLNAVSISALLLLAADPRALFDASFQLTVLSVLAIAGIGVPVLERTSEPYRQALHNLDTIDYDMAFAPRLAQFRLDLRMIGERLRKLLPFSGGGVGRLLVGAMLPAIYVFDTLVISAVAQIALALPMTLYFHRATVLGLPANIIVVPLTGVLMPAATAGVALSYIAAWLAKPAVVIAGWSLSGITGAIRVLGGLRAADWRVPTPTLLAALFAVAAFAGCLWGMRKRRVIAVLGAAALGASALALALVSPKPQLQRGALEVTGIDVGQADATLIVTPQGKTLLVDAAGSLGPGQSEFDFGEDVIAPYLWWRGIGRLDAVALTHAHSDHIGGMRSMIANFRPRELWIGPNALTPALLALLRQASANEVAVIRRRGGERFEFGGAQVEVLSPPPDWQLAPKPRNNDSLVLRIGYGETAALLEGDAERKMERQIAERQPRASLIKVGHNGSTTSTTPELLDAVSPRFAFISVGAHNSFRHPRPEVLDRLGSRGIVTYRTDTAGMVSFALDGREVRLLRPSVPPARLPR